MEPRKNGMRKINFNPRSREGSDRQCHNQQYSVSYFNPRSREGSDFPTMDITKVHAISIHAPAKGATSFPSCKCSSLVNFNPRSREGSDGTCRGIVGIKAISIHAPAKGATSQSFFSQSTYFDFNPRSREGSDFISRLTGIGLTNFNPRSREGSDSKKYHKMHIFNISIHAPAKGATPIPDPTIQIFYDFNPRSREGSDCKRKHRSIIFF